jgi:transposase
MTSKELEQLAQRAKNSRMRNRYLAVSHFVDGKSRTDIAKYLKVARGSVNIWVQKYLNDGIDALNEARHTGRPTKLSATQLEQLSVFIQENSTLAKGGRLQAKDIQSYITEHFSVEYEISNIYRLLHHLNFSWITSRSRHPKQDEGAQTLFKKLSHGNDPSHSMENPVR